MTSKIFAFAAVMVASHVASADNMTVQSGRAAVNVFVGGQYYATIPGNATLTWGGFRRNTSYRITLENTQTKVRRSTNAYAGTTVSARQLFRTRPRPRPRPPQPRPPVVDPVAPPVMSASYPGCQQIQKVRRLWRRHGNGANKKEFRLMERTLCSGNYRIGASVYYPNGRVATYGFGKKGASWYYPNGRVATYSAGKRSASWYYPNGRVATYNFSGSTWYYPNGRTMSY